VTTEPLVVGERVPVRNPTTLGADTATRSHRLLNGSGKEPQASRQLPPSGVEVESAARAAAEGVAQPITGSEGNSTLGLVQEWSRRANVGLWPVGDTAAGEHVDHLGCAGGTWVWKRRTPGATVSPSPVVGTAHDAVRRTVTSPAAAAAWAWLPVLRLMSRLAWLSSSTDSPSRTASAGRRSGAAPRAAGARTRRAGCARRYRLNRGGDRQANAALYRIVVRGCATTTRPRTTWPVASAGASPRRKPFAV
jgi:hypothetical protein